MEEADMNAMQEDRRWGVHPFRAPGCSTRAGAAQLCEDWLRQGLRILGSLAFAALVAGCGGGGSGGSSTPPPVAAITTQPVDQSAVAGATVLFSVTATDATGYQWQKSTDGGATFSNLSGASSAAYTKSALALGDSGTRYRVVVSGASNS